MATQTKVLSRDMTRNLREESIQMASYRCDSKLAEIRAPRQMVVIIIMAVLFAAAGVLCYESQVPGFGSTLSSLVGFWCRACALFCIHFHVIYRHEDQATPA